MDDKRRTDTKRRILVTAVDHFAEQGIHGASIRDICKQVGVRESAFYKHFPSKDALVEAVYNEYETLLEKPVLSEEAIASLLAKFSLFDFLWGASKNFLKPEDSLPTRIWLILMGDQFRNPRAAGLLNKEVLHLRQNMSVIFTCLLGKGILQDGDAEALTCGFCSVLLHTREQLFREILLREPASTAMHRAENYVAALCRQQTFR